MPSKLFISPPVGWGSFNLLVSNWSPRDGPLVITDGGTLPGCAGSIPKGLVSKIGTIVRGYRPRVWVASHFDYDHISIASQILSGAGVDLCLLPYVYSLDACRRVLALHLAIESMLLRVPRLPEALGSISKVCHRKVRLVRDGTRVVVDSRTHYEFIWPPRVIVDAEETCASVQDELRNKVGELAKRGEIDREGLSRTYEAFLGELNRLGRDEVVDVIDLREEGARGPDEEAETGGKASSERGAKTLETSCDIEAGKALARIYNGFPGLARIKTALLNAFSVAYVIRHQGEAFHLVLDSDLLEHLMGRPFFPNNSLRELAFRLHWFGRPKIALKSCDSSILFLGDLDDNAINEALRSPKGGFDVVIAAHHGNSWSDLIHGKLAYVQRCFEHPPRKTARSFRWEYCENMPCIIGGHKYGLVSRLEP